jgi:alpha-glucosidase (family GH31 glycosyl hydrolase)
MLKLLVIIGLIVVIFAQLPLYRRLNLRQTSNGLECDLSLQSGHGPYRDDIKELKLQVFYLTKDILRVRITDKQSKRWEVPENNIKIKTPSVSDFNNNYKVEVSDPFAIIITRLSDNEIIFDSTKEQFVYSKYYITIGTSLTTQNPNIYGLGERVHNFRLDPTDKTYVLWNKDAFNVDFKNLYGSHPFHIEKRKEKAHGVFLFNSNAMDVTIRPFGMQYRTIGGVIDLFFFMGTTPESVTRQYQEVVGKPVMIPYWSLGFHQCRWGYKDIDETKSIVDKYRENRIPLDTMWNDIDYMDKFKLFTFDPVKYPLDRMKSFVNQLHSNGQHYVMIVDPGVKVEKGYDVYEKGLTEKVYITQPDGVTPTVNKVWPGLTVFPDFTSEKTYQYWEYFLKKFYEDVPYDGLWLDMNEIAGFCH